MQKYIALLRGVNVGGNHMLPMAQLSARLTEEGFFEVSTYIQSGNVLFSCEPEAPEALQTRVSAVIARHFGFSVPVCVLSASELSEAMDGAPPWWDADKESKHNVIFVVAPASAEDVFAQVGQLKPQYEQTAHVGRVIFWSAPVATFSRTRLLRVVGTAVYDFITIRNANTARKLLELARL